MSYSDTAGGKPTYWTQGVKLLRSPVEVDVASIQQESHLASSAVSLMKVAANFDSCSGDLKVDVSII